MGTTQTWQAFLAISDGRWQFLGMSPCLDQLLRWCRQSVRTITGRGDVGRAEVVLFRYDDRPSCRNRKPRLHPFNWDAAPQDGWQRVQVFKHPFKELLGERERFPSDATRKGAGRQRPDGRRVTRSQVTGVAGAFDESASTVDTVELASAAQNKLLFWLSAAGSGRRDEFLRTCQILGLAQDGRQARRILRRLILLGHLSDDGVRWTMQPPTLAPLALEPELVVLRGQRTPALLACLPDNREEIAQPSGPDRVCSCLPVEAGVPTVSVGGACFRLEQDILSRAQKLLGWREWTASLKSFDIRDLWKFVRTERWDGVNWVGTSLHYDQPTHRVVGPGGMYRLTQELSVRSPLTVCFDAEGRRILRGDWYGLRFLAGKLGNNALHAEWDQSGQEFFVPSEEHWPFDYEQILVQASGFLPSLSRRAGWLCYSSIPQELAAGLCAKLDILLRLIGPRPNRQLSRFPESLETRRSIPTCSAAR